MGVGVWLSISILRSSGANEEQDYAWVRVSEQPEAAQTPQSPPVLSDRSIDELIYRQHFSLLLGRYYGKPALQVTGLAASTRRIINDGSLSFHQTRYLGKTSMDDLQPTNDHPLGGELSPQYPA